MAWAKSNDHVVLTHDLDFGAILAATGADSPSVIQIRTQDVTPAGARDILIAALAGFADQLEEGALISLDESRARVRILPIN